MAASGQRHPRLRRGAYLLPSLFTIGNILLGFYAVVRGLKGEFQDAVLLIFAAAVLDALDGRIARLTGTDSAFGREYDSLADVITFGMAPALLAFFWGLDDLGRVGWLVPLFYVVCTATRLARFNVQTRVTDKRYFAGLPAPAAAGALGSILFLAPDPEGRPWIGACLLASLIFLGLLMVSTVRYHSFKQIDLRRRRSYRVILLLAAFVLVIAYHPEAFFLSVAGVYALSGPTGWLAGRLRQLAPAHRAEKKST
jgi:CDP-diacylglycerol--serine O-phosphatidyltransferase